MRETEEAPTASSASSRRHYLPLDSMRGLAALVVVFHHFIGANTFRDLFPDMGLLDNALFRNGRLCVDLFFVLSGIVIAMTYVGRGDRFSFREFMTKRLARVYPLFVAMLLAFLAFRIARLGLTAAGLLPPSPAAADGPDPNDLSTFLANVFLVHALGVTDTLSWNGPSWSISAEFWTYVLFALVFGATRPFRSSRALAAVSAAIVAASFATILFALRQPDMDFHFRFGVLRCTYGFFIGVLTCLAFRRMPSPPSVPRAWQEILQWGALGGAVAVIALAEVRPDGAGVAAFVFAALFAALMVFPETSLAALLSTGAPVWLGQRSYSIYMTHVLVIMVSEYALRMIGRPRIERLNDLVPAGPAYLWAALIVAVVLVLSELTFRLIERPGSRLIRSAFAERGLHPLASRR